MKVKKMKKNKVKDFINCFLVFFLLLGLSSTKYLAGSTIFDINLEMNKTNLFDKSAWGWIPMELIAPETIDADSYYSSVAVDSEGNIHVVYEDWSGYFSHDREVVYKFWNASLEVWSAPERISSETNGGFNPSFALDKQDNVHVVWDFYQDYGGAGYDGDIFYRVKNATTGTWMTTELVSKVSTDVSSHADLCIDSMNRPQVVWVDLTDLSCGVDKDIFYCYRDISGIWSPTVVVSYSSNNDSENPKIVCDSYDVLHIIWQDKSDIESSGSDIDIFYRNSLTPNITLVSSESDSDSLYPSMEIDFMNNIHIIWVDSTDYCFSGTDKDIFYRRKTSSNTWGVTEVATLESSQDIPYYASIAVDNSGLVYVAWSDSTDYPKDGDIDADIFVRYRDPIFESWSYPMLVSDISAHGSKRPSLTIDNSNYVYTVWDDDTPVFPTDPKYFSDIFFSKFMSPPNPPELSPIYPNPTENSLINLQWNDDSETTIYYIYRSESFIWSEDNLIAIDSTINNFYTDNLPNELTYYYVIVAGNQIGNSTHSNCVSVVYQSSHVREFFVTTSIILVVGVIVALLTSKRRKKL